MINFQQPKMAWQGGRAEAPQARGFLYTERDTETGKPRHWRGCGAEIPVMEQ